MAYFDADENAAFFERRRTAVDLETPLDHYVSAVALGESVTLKQVYLQDAQAADPLTAAVYERVARHLD